MQIRTLIAVGGATCLAAVMAAAVMMHISYRDFYSAQQQTVNASLIGEASSNLSILTGEYLLYGGKRAETQWLGKHESLGRLLASYDAGNDMEKEEIERLRKEHIEAKEVFSQLTDVMMTSGPIIDTTTTPHTHNPLEVRLITQLLTTLHTMVGVASRMVARLEESVEMTMLNLVKILGVIFISIFIILTSGWILTTWRIARPLEMLHQGIDSIATGKLDYRIVELHQDEIGSVAGRINAMAKNLKDTLVSRDSLKEEIVQRQHAEEELKKTLAALAQANDELQQFTYSVSHDLRAPLRAINGFSEALLEDYGDELKGDAHVYLKYLSDGAQEMGNLIDDLLKLSRATRGEIAMGDVDLSGIAAKVVDDLKKTETSRRAEFVIQPGVSAFADPRLMRVVLENLLGNAFKFTRQEPKARIEFSACHEDGKVACHVRDNGIGFDMAYVDKLFTPFQRLNQKSDFEGTGIGLSTVRRIIAHHGGRTWAEGALGEGASFYFELPMTGEPS